MLLEAPEVPDDELAVAGRGGDLVGPVLVAGHDLDGAGEQINILMPSLNSNLQFLIRNPLFKPYLDSSVRPKGPSTGQNRIAQAFR